MVAGGGGEIRTLGGLSPSLVFKTSALNRSATPPRKSQSTLPYYLGKCRSFFSSELSYPHDGNESRCFVASCGYHCTRVRRSPKPRTTSGLESSQD